MLKTTGQVLSAGTSITASLVIPSMVGGAAWLVFGSVLMALLGYLLGVGVVAMLTHEG